MTVKLTIVIPCYNEAENIPLLLERFAAVIHRDDVEVLLVDNGSTDHSADVLATEVPCYPFASLLAVPVNQGYGYGILQGLSQAQGEFIGWTHADLQTEPGDVMHALELIEKQSGPEKIYLKGQRRGRPFFDNIFTCGMSLFESLVLCGGFWDINAQPNIFHRSFFQQWDNPPHDFSLDLYAYYMAQRNRLQIIRFDVSFPKRIHGKSKWNTSLGAKWKFIKRTVDFTYKLRARL